MCEASASDRTEARSAARRTIATAPPAPICVVRLLRSGSTSTRSGARPRRGARPRTRSLGSSGTGDPERPLQRLVARPPASPLAAPAPAPSRARAARPTSRPPRNSTVRAPARPSLIRASCSSSRFSTGSGTGPKRSSSSSASSPRSAGSRAAGDPAVHVDLRDLVGDVVARDVRVHRHVEAHRLPGSRLASAVLGCAARRSPPRPASGSRARTRPPRRGPTARSPSRLPAPRISRSRIAILNPEPELRVVRERREPRRRLGAERRRGGIEQIGVGTLAGATDAAADLVELGQPEPVRPLDDQRVRLRDVEPRLDDRRRDEHVGPRRAGSRASSRSSAAASICP